MRFAAQLAGAAAQDGARLVGAIVGSVYAGFEGAVTDHRRRKGITSIEVPDSGPRYADLDYA